MGKAVVVSFRGKFEFSSAAYVLAARTCVEARRSPGYAIDVSEETGIRVRAVQIENASREMGAAFNVLPSELRRAF